jgi:hypothetical protein
MAKRKSSNSDDDLIKEAREAFQRAEDAESDNRAAAIESIKFARAGEQWPEAVANQRRAEGKPMLTINKMPAFIRQVVNDARQNKPAIKVHPADSGADVETAKVLNGLIKNIEYTSNADTAYDTAIECAVSGGFGYWRVSADYAYDDAFEMDLRIDRVSNPFAVYGDPNSREADSSDWDVAFVVDRLSKKQFKADYPDAAEVDWDSDAWRAVGGDWLNEDGVLVAEWWVREKVDREILQLSDGRVVGKDDMKPEVQMLIDAGIVQIVGERVTKSCKVTQRIISGLEVLKETDWPGKYIPIVPVYGDEFDIEGKRYLRSLVHNSMDAQRMYNYWRTTGTELVALAPRVPYIGPEDAFSAEPDKWATINVKSHPYVAYSGPVAPQRQPLDSGPAAGALQEAMNASDDMKATMGLFDASLGAKSNETSGKAIMARQREGDVSTFHFVDNLARGIRHTGRIIIDLIPHFYNKERVVRVIGEDGAQKPVTINAPTQATDKTGEPILDEAGNAMMALHDLTAGKYDLTVTTGPSFTTRREEAAMHMTEILRAFPQGAPIIAPLLAKNLDWPGADEMAEKFEALSSGQLPPEVMQQIEEGKQELQRLTEENQQLKMDQSIEQAKLEMEAQANQQKMMMEREQHAQEMELERQKAQDARQLELMKAGIQHEVAMQKAGSDREIAMKKVGNDRDIAAMKMDGVEQTGKDGKKSVKAPAEVMVEGLAMLGELIIKQGDGQAKQMQQLAKIVAAPNEIVRDKTGRAAGSRKVVQ